MPIKIKPGRIVQNFIKSQFNLSTHSSMNKSSLGQVMRLFDLKKGESVHLKGLVGDDYIFVSKGNIVISGEGCSTNYLVANRQYPKPFLIPENSKVLNIEAEEDCLFYHIDHEKLDYVLAWDELGLLLGDTNELLKQRMDVISNSLAFSQLSIGNVKEALHLMKEVSVKSGDNVISEAEDGKAYYVIAEGIAEVWQTLEEEDAELVATLEQGDGFGEEGVVIGTHANTVTMKTDGLLLALEKDDFDDLLSNKMIETKNKEEVKKLIKEGYKLLDVRMDWELEFYGKIEGSLHVPLHDIREQYTEIDSKEKYVVYCKSGNRSQVGCLFLEQRGIEAISLDGGYTGWLLNNEKSA